MTVEAETLDARCTRLREELTTAEFDRLKQSYTDQAKVDLVSGSVGPLYYAAVVIGKIPVKAMVDPGSSATIISFEKFKEVGRQMGIQADSLKRPNLTLYDYSQKPIPVGATVELTFKWKEQEVTTQVYIRAEGNKGEPCLLGTNVVIPLGLMKPDPDLEEQEVGQNSSTTHTVNLVSVARIPGYCAVIGKGKVTNSTNLGKHVIFDPDPRWMTTNGVEMEPSILEPDNKGMVDLVICNVEGSTKKLSSSLGIGTACNLPAEDELVTQVSMVRGRYSDAQEKLSQLLNISKEGISPEESDKLRECLLQASDVFALDADQLGQVTEVCHTIDTGGSAPVQQTPRRIPFSLRSGITSMINEMLGAGVIRESSSPWASPIVLVKKKNGGIRFCVDYRRLNALTRKDVYPMPRIDDILDQLGGKRVFSTLDARTGYWQIKVDEGSREKTAFTTMDGLYEFCVMPFGLCNAPATFQRLLQKTLAGLGGDKPFCKVYIDDIIVFSDTVQSHIVHLQQVLDRLRSINLKLHPEKCNFCCQEVQFLGHIVSAEGISPNPEQVAAVKDFKVPQNVKGVRRFLGLAGYYRRFIVNFSKIASPLYNLLKQDIPFVWTQACQEAFNKLISCLVTAPVLAYPCFTKPFVLHTDASALGLGAVLEQEQDDRKLHPVAYASRTLSKQEGRYGITDLEALALVWACRHFRAYLLGHHCIVVTDHAPLKALVSAKHQSGKLARWSDTIAELDLDIQYRPGRKHMNADALSRHPMDTTNAAVEERDQQVEVVNQVISKEDLTAGKDTSEMARLQLADPLLAQMHNYLSKGVLPEDAQQARKLTLQKDQFIIQDGLLYFVDTRGNQKLRLVVPTSLQELLMKETHAGPFGGHFAAKGLYNTLAQQYWWEGMFSDVVKWCRSCLTCAAYQGFGRRKPSPLKTISVGSPLSVWVLIS